MTPSPSTANLLAAIAAVSRQLGANASYVQGGGGNTSCKLDERIMWVKASGAELAQVTGTQGLVAVDYPAIRAGLVACRSDEAYQQLVQNSRVAGQASQSRPSIETGFHALLGSAVVHSHSVWVNLLACAEEGEAVLHKLFPDALWVAYATPGLAITQAVAHALHGNASARVLFLQNHGLIVSGDSAAEVWQRHEAVNATIREHLRIAEAALSDAPEMVADEAHLLFPDQAVYLGHEALRHSKAGIETQQAYNFLRATMETLRLTPHYLPASEASRLLQMEAEKYRQKVAQS